MFENNLVVKCRTRQERLQNMYMIGNESFVYKNMELPGRKTEIPRTIR